MTNAQCLSEEENPKVEDMAVGMIIAKVGLDFNIEVNAESYVPIYHQMKGWLLSEKKNSTLNFGEDRCYLPRGFRKILLMYFNMKVRKKQMNEKDKQLEEFKLIAQAVIPAINCIKIRWKITKSTACFL